MLTVFPRSFVKHYWKLPTVVVLVSEDETQSLKYPQYFQISVNISVRKYIIQIYVL